jgi:hypothetical protein
MENNPRYIQDPNFRISSLMQKALDWWMEMPMVDIYENLGWANLVLLYYPSKTNCQDVTNEEILFMYIQENNL